MTRRQAIVCIGGYHCGLTVAVPRVPGCPLDSWPAQAQDQRGAPGRARAQRKRGWLPVADPPVTLKDVAARARVHPATASRALNPETRLLVREDTAQRVLDAAAARGCPPGRPPGVPPGPPGPAPRAPAARTGSGCSSRT